MSLAFVLSLKCTFNNVMSCNFPLKFVNPVGGTKIKEGPLPFASPCTLSFAEKVGYVGLQLSTRHTEMCSGYVARSIWRTGEAGERVKNVMAVPRPRTLPRTTTASLFDFCPRHTHFT